MGAPRTVAPYVVIGPDGKEYGAPSLEVLGEWWSKNTIHGACRVWSTDAQKWTTVKELGVHKPRPVLVSTGDVKREYRVIDVVFGFVGKDTPAFSKIDVPAAFNEVTDQLASAAASRGAHAVIFASYSHASGGALGGAGFFASGTAVQFTTKE